MRGKKNMSKEIRLKIGLGKRQELWGGGRGGVNKKLKLIKH